MVEWMRMMRRRFVEPTRFRRSGVDTRVGWNIGDRLDGILEEGGPEDSQCTRYTWTRQGANWLRSLLSRYHGSCSSILTGEECEPTNRLPDKRECSASPEHSDERRWGIWSLVVTRPFLRFKLVGNRGDCRIRPVETSAFIVTGRG